MRLFSITGRLVYRNVSHCRIKWSGKSRSKAQYKVKQFFKRYWFDHICYEEFPVYGTMMKIDLLNASKKIAIEVDGEQHEEFNPFFHQGSRLNYLYSIGRDYKKEEWLEKNGFKLIKIKISEIDGLCPEFIKQKFGIDLV